MKYGDKNLFVDLGVEKIIGAERGVEVKGFTGQSEVTELHRATGQYVLHSYVLRQVEPDRRLVLAVPDDVLRGVFERDLGRLLLDNGAVRVVGYDPLTEELTRWLP